MQSLKGSCREGKSSRASRSIGSPSYTDALFHVMTRLYRAQQMKEIGCEMELSEQANQKAKQKNESKGEFLARRGFLLLYFRKKK